MKKLRISIFSAFHPFRGGIAQFNERLAEELEKELEGKITKDDIEDSIQKLISSGDVFTPRKGFVQRI